MSTNNERLNPTPGTPYHSYLLRYWQEEPAGPDDLPAWRCIVESVSDQAGRWGFSSLEALLAFLAEQLAYPPAAPPANEEEEA